MIREKLENWQHFLAAENELDPLIRVAIQHYQFEAIHPFTDGNGRTGRILNILYLVQQGLLDNPILYLSRYIIRNKADYYRLLLEVTTQQSWEPWILYMLDGIENTCLWTTDKIKAIRELMQHTGNTSSAACRRCIRGSSSSFCSSSRTVGSRTWSTRGSRNGRRRRCI